MAGKGMDNFPTTCYFCTQNTAPKVKYLGNFEEAILHVGISHHDSPYRPVETKKRRAPNHEYLFEPEEIHHMNHKRSKNDKLTANKGAKIQEQNTPIFQKTTKTLISQSSEDTSD